MFRDYLRALENQLDIPYPQRRDVVAEIEAHLEDLRAEFVQRGISADEAHRRATAAMSADAEFVQAMAEVHRTAVALALSGLPRHVSLGIEYGAVVLVGFVLIFTTILKEAAMIEFIAGGGFFMIPINVAGIAVLLLGLERLYSLFIKKDHSEGNLRKRLLSMSFLAVVCALTGVVGTLLGLYEAFSMADQIAAKFGGEFPIFEVARIAMTTAIWGMTISLLAVVLRFVIEAKAARIIEMRTS